MHDAARPLVSDEVIERVVAPLSQGWDGAVPGLAVVDTVKRVAADGAVVETLAARRARRRPDPAGVRRATCCARLSPATSAAASDCASLVEARGGRVLVVEGDPRLMKVTTPEDLALVESWLAAEQQ